VEKPTNVNTKAEVQAYLDGIGIEYSNSATKAELLELIPADEPEIHEAEIVEEMNESEEVKQLPDLEADSEHAIEEVVPELPKEEKVPKPKAPMRFTKWQLVYQSSFNPRQKDIFKLALNDNIPYTMKEVWDLVDQFTESLWW